MRYFLLFIILVFIHCQSPVRVLEEMKFQPGKKRVFILISEQISSFEVVKNSFMEEGKNDYQFLSLNLDGNYDDIDKLPAQIKKLNPDLILCIGSKSLESNGYSNFICNGFGLSKISTGEV